MFTLKGILTLLSLIALGVLFYYYELEKDDSSSLDDNDEDE